MNNNFVDGYARSLVQRAARRAPASLAERLEEEWLADFEERKSGVARLRFGMGCAWATRVIAHEYLEPKVATATATASANGATVAATHYDGPDYSVLSGRTVAVFGIIGLHVLIIYGFASGLVQHVFVKSVPPVSVLQPTPREIKSPPVLNTDPTFQKIPIVQRDPDVKFDEETDTQPMATTTEVTQPPEVIRTTPPPPAVKRVEGGAGKGFPSSDEFYPLQDIRLRNTGLTVLSVCTDERGRLTGDPTLAQTSGTASLDQGAVKLAKAASGRYRATTEDGRAVSSCFPLRVRFQLRD